MKCDIVKDLLPLYVDGLVRPLTRDEIEEHLQDCTDCRTQYGQMQTVLPVEPMKADTEINYLKKIKEKHVRNILICVIILIVLFISLTLMFGVGSSVKSKDMTYSYKILEAEDFSFNEKTTVITPDGKSLEISHGKQFMVDLELKNGKQLIVRTDWKTELGEDGKAYVTCTATPYSIFDNPFDDVGTVSQIGCEISDAVETKIILRFADKDIILLPSEIAQQKNK